MTRVGAMLYDFLNDTGLKETKDELVSLLHECYPEHRPEALSIELETLVTRGEVVTDGIHVWVPAEEEAN